MLLAPWNSHLDCPFLTPSLQLGGISWRTCVPKDLIKSKFSLWVPCNGPVIDMPWILGALARAFGRRCAEEISLLTFPHAYCLILSSFSCSYIYSPHSTPEQTLPLPKRKKSKKHARHWDILTLHILENSRQPYSVVCRGWLSLGNRRLRKELPHGKTFRSCEYRRHQRGSRFLFLLRGTPSSTDRRNR